VTTITGIADIRRWRQAEKSSRTGCPIKTSRHAPLATVPMPQALMGMMGGGIMGRGYGHPDCRDRSIIGSMMMRIIFSLMDADGDGTVSLQEFQAAHERIFKAMDTDHDGTVSLEEMQAFIRGH
jgi:hypothetical protein